ncbi:MAG: DUF4190 domain-containing protein [Lachnospiraceae bacterium]|nr:DUF4190 domain-containing protein [Lachnospiraceae bacterium]
MDNWNNQPLPDTNSYPDYEQDNKGDTPPYMRDYRIQPGYQSSNQNQDGGSQEAYLNIQYGYDAVRSPVPDARQNAYPSSQYGYDVARGPVPDARQNAYLSSQYGDDVSTGIPVPDARQNAYPSSQYGYDVARSPVPNARRDAYENSQYGYTNQPKSKGNGLAIAGLVLGILSILFFWTMPVAMILAIVGIVLSAIGLSKNQSRGLGIAGMVTSIIGGLLALLTIVFLFFALSRMDMYDTHGSDDDYYSPFPYAGEEESPFDDFDDFFDGLR